MTYIITNG